MHTGWESTFETNKQTKQGKVFLRNSQILAKSEKWHSLRKSTQALGNPSASPGSVFCLSWALHTLRSLNTG